jgi:iron transport multicopper oxidase
MSPFRLANALALLMFANVALAATVTYNWDVTWVSVNPDGQKVRPAVGINGKWPCPAINANVGDRVVVNVNNKLGNETTTIHFHGLPQQGSSSMDGPVGVTQCPIPPGGSFTYDFKVA